jgi:hypothetical protein
MYTVLIYGMSTIFVDNLPAFAFLKKVCNMLELKSSAVSYHISEESKGAFLSSVRSIHTSFTHLVA